MIAGQQVDRLLWGPSFSAVPASTFVQDDDSGYSKAYWCDLRQREVVTSEHFPTDPKVSDDLPQCLYRVDKETRDFSASEMVSEAAAIDAACMA